MTAAQGPGSGGRSPPGLGPRPRQADPPGPGRKSSPSPGQAAQFPAGRQSRRQGLRAARPCRSRALGSLGLFPGRAGRTWRDFALRRGIARRAARIELPFSLPGRDRAHAQGIARQQDRHRHARGRGRPPFRHSRQAGREPDAHRRREHRRRRLLGAVESEADENIGHDERRRRLSVQYPEPRHDRERGRRERHARGGWPVEDPADPLTRSARRPKRPCRS